MFFNDEYLPVRKENSRGKVRIPGSKNLKSLILEAQMKQNGTGSPEAIRKSRWKSWIHQLRRVLVRAQRADFDWQVSSGP